MAQQDVKGVADRIRAIQGDRKPRMDLEPAQKE